MMKKIVDVLLVVFLLWVLVSTIDIDIHNENPNHHYSVANFYEVLLTVDAQIKPSPTTTEVVLVVECSSTEDGLYEVVVRDTDGNDWVYYDDTPQSIHDILAITFREKEIVDVK